MQRYPRSGGAVTTAKDILDIGGIDALLERFRHRRVTQRRLDESARSFSVDAPTTLRPEVLASTRLRFEKISERLTTEMGDLLRRPVHATLRRQEQERLGAFLMKLPRPGTTFRIEIAELEQPALVWCDGATISSMIELRLGGRGEGEGRDRALTKIERRIIDDILAPLVGAHARGLATVQPLTLETGANFHRPEELGPVAYAETYLVTEYELELGLDRAWKMGFALPVGQLVDALEATAALPVTPDENDGDRRRALEHHLNGVRVATSVDIGSTELSLADVTALEPGDVIVLDRRRDDALDLRVEGVVKYRGRLGRRGQSLAFAVDGALEPKPSTPKGAQGS
jgi:flagellar motor switch protein FliM